MEVAIGANGSTPFQREVREWQRVDPNTGALMSGRLEADRWINGPLNAYGKVVDSQNVSKPNGTQHTQRKQLEVLQARTSSGSLQVVRAQTVQTSSSRWSSSPSSSPSSGTQATQSSSFEGHRFSNGLHLTNGHLLDGHDQYQNHQQQQLTNSNQLNSRLLATPSLKLSSLMQKSSPAAAVPSAVNGGDRISPHSPSNHEPRESLTSSSCRYQPTLGETRVGVGGSLEQQMESFRNNEREIRDSSNTLIEENHHVHLPRGRSISTDDLSTEWDQNEDGDESSEWRRVSKIRRSFQFPKSTSPKPSMNSNRPLDLPENSVSVSRIREELENGRRLSTAMRNNHVDLAALSSILNATTESDAKTVKKTSFLTAESLKEIRGRLKKLSDESLYKDDFIIQKETDGENDTMTESKGGIQVEKPVVLQDAQVIQQQQDFQYRPILDSKLATNSLENRLRYRDTTSSEWHLRRKSYGFEKMTPQDHSIFRSEPSTDSGIGRSGELSNWSPTESTPRTTIIKFGENSTPTVMSGSETSSSKPMIQRRYPIRNSDTEEVKRHSIAVDESKYVRDNLRKVFDSKTSVHLNGLYLKEANSSQVSIGEENGRKQKRVEFCKTEVHFAAESGRVNIVETDGKPPPTNNFRRRRRSSGGGITSYLDAMNSGMPVIHFGDEKKTLFEQETAVEEIQAMKNNVTVSLAVNNGCAEPLASGKDDEDENADEISLRGILKNKPAKPKPYHLGENFDSKDNLWGVRLRPVTSELISPKPNDEEDVEDTKVQTKSLTQTDDLNPIKSVAERIRIVEERKDGSGYSTKINLNLSNSPYAWNSAEIRKSNVTSIDLRSPVQTPKKIPQSPVAISARSEAPIAQPRTVTTVKTSRSNHNETIERSVYKTESIRSPVLQKPAPSKDKEPLKVVTGGARKLREHELSYFGVKVNNNSDEKPRAVQRTLTNSESNRKPVEMEVTSKWSHLPSDKPDLLRHSPDGSTNTSSRQEDDKSRPKDGPIYENLKKPSSYSRKKDLQRDEMILSEMTKSADQTLKAVGSNNTQKDHPRRASQRSTRPLDTIQEVQASHSKHSQKSMKSKGIQVSRLASEGFQRQCCSNRPSSASSTESLSRLSTSSSVGRSRSRSRDQTEKIEYAAVKQTKKLTSPVKECSKVKSRRSTSHASSSEDLVNVHHRSEPRKVKRSKPKEKESISKSEVRTRSSGAHRACVESEDRSRTLSKSPGYEQIRKSHRSAKEEKERVSSSRTKVSSASDYQQKTQTKSSSAVIASTRSSTSSSSKRPSKDYSIRK